MLINPPTEKATAVQTEQTLRVRFPSPHHPPPGKKKNRGKKEEVKKASSAQLARMRSSLSELE